MCWLTVTLATLPGTIDNDFRKKSGAVDEKNEGLQEKLLLKQQDGEFATSLLFHSPRIISRLTLTLHNP
jgi:hypothetical protein